MDKYNDITIDEVKSAFNHAIQQSCTPDPEKFTKPEKGQIFDEEKSVRWNKEELERRIAAYDEERKRLIAEYDNGFRKAEDFCKQWIKQKTKLNDRQVAIIYNFAYEHHHAYLNDMVDHIDEYIDLFNNVRSNMWTTAQEIIIGQGNVNQ